MNTHTHTHTVVLLFVRTMSGLMHSFILSILTEGSVQSQDQQSVLTFQKCKTPVQRWTFKPVQHTHKHTHDNYPLNTERSGLC